MSPDGNLDNLQVSKTLCWVYTETHKKTAQGKQVLHFSKILKPRLIYSTTSTFAETFRSPENIVGSFFFFKELINDICRLLNNPLFNKYTVSVQLGFIIWATQWNKYIGLDCFWSFMLCHHALGLLQAAATIKLNHFSSKCGLPNYRSHNRVTFKPGDTLFPCLPLLSTTHIHTHYSPWKWLLSLPRWAHPSSGS